MAVEDEDVKALWLSEGDALLLVSSEHKIIYELALDENGDLDITKYEELGGSDQPQQQEQQQQSGPQTQLLEPGQEPGDEEDQTEDDQGEEEEDDTP